LKCPNVSEVCTATTKALMMEAVYISETSVNFNVTTRCYIPEDLNFMLAIVRTRNLTSKILHSRVGNY
jgi:hypothetical protein